jgi:hypothetical protein
MDTYDEQCLVIAEAAFQRIADQFKFIKMERDKSAQVEVRISIPAQPALKHGVVLVLQNRDELHFSAGNFRLEWAPCSDPSIVEAYIQAVTGFMSGRYRILEHYQGDRYKKGELQVLAEGKQWETVGVSRRINLILGGRKQIKEIINSQK